MPTILSTLKDKIYGREWSFPYNCYETGHGWTPYCSSAACDVGLAAFTNALPLYSSLYLFTQLGLQRKYSFDAFTETLKSTLTSASFLGFNFFAGIAVSCLMRQNSDRYYFRTQCLLPGFVASYMALLIERPSRRPALAFYLANMSSELLYKYSQSKGYAISVPHGETLLFAAGMACWLRFVRIHGFGHDPVSSAMKYLIGPLEAKSKARVKQIKDHGEDDTQLLQLEGSNSISSKSRNSAKRTTLTAIDDSINDLLAYLCDKHPVCPHDGVNCLHYSLTPAVTRFIWGYLGRSLLSVGTKPMLLLKSPVQVIRDAFTSRISINFGLALGSFVGGSKAVHCILRRLQGKQEDWHSAMAGGLSGMSMLFAPRSTLSTYIIWKCLEQYFFLAVRNGTIKRADEMICFTYAISVNILLYIFAIEPRFIRPSYMKFIDKVSDHKLHQVNRLVLDIFNRGASVGYEDWFPNLDPKFMTREFHELVFNWLIQPY